MSTETVEVVVVGAGQAGIAMSEHLGALGIEHVVLERSRVDHCVDSLQGPPDPSLITDIADEEPYRRITIRGIRLAHLKLLQLVS